MTVRHLPRSLCRHLGTNVVRQVIVDRINYLNFLPQIARCVRLAYSEDETLIIGMFRTTSQSLFRLSVDRFEISAADAIMFLVDVYRAAGDSAEHGRMTMAKLTHYRQFRHILQVHWHPICNAAQPSHESAIDSQQANSPLRPTAKLQRFRVQWERLGDLLGGISTRTSNFWSEQEMLGCFNVECACYGQKPLHRLRECKRCRIAHYCNEGCQRK